MDVGRSVAEATRVVVGVEAAGGEGVTKMLKVLVGGFGQKVAAGFRVLEAFGLFRRHGKSKIDEFITENRNVSLFLMACATC